MTSEARLEALEAHVRATEITLAQVIEKLDRVSKQLHDIQLYFPPPRTVWAASAPGEMAK